MTLAAYFIHKTFLAENMWLWVGLLTTIWPLLCSCPAKCRKSLLWWPTTGFFLFWVVTVQSQQNLRFNASLYHPVVVLRTGRPEVRILPVAPENLIAMCFLQWGFLFLLVFDFQNNFSSISSAASVYCPFPRRSFLSLFIVIRMRRISSVEKVAFLSAGTESIFSISRPGFSVLCPSALCW